MSLSIKRNGQRAFKMPKAEQKIARIETAQVKVMFMRRRLAADALSNIRQWEAEAHKIWQRYNK